MTERGGSTLSAAFAVYDKNRERLTYDRLQSAQAAKKRARELDKVFGMKGRFVPVLLTSDGKWEQVF